MQKLPYNQLPADPTHDTPEQKFQRHYRSLIQEFKDYHIAEEEYTPARKYLEHFEETHDDLSDLNNHIQILKSLTGMVERIRDHWLIRINSKDHAAS